MASKFKLFINVKSFTQLHLFVLCSLRLTPLREFTMMQLMDQLTDKPDWDTKVLAFRSDRYNMRVLILEAIGFR